MGRRYRAPAWEPEFNDQPVKGVETSGKVFFEAPQLIVVGKPKVPTYYNPDVPYPDSVVRLRSSRLLPICPIENQPTYVPYELSERPSFTELRDYMKNCAAFGYDKGAIVARRWTSPWRMKNVTEWGVITYTVMHAPQMQQICPGPFNVMWLDKNIGQERAWAEDLIVIHAALDTAVLDRIIEAQTQEELDPRI